MLRPPLFSALVLAAVALGIPQHATSTPLLQLDIAGGAHDSASKTTTATTNAFTLYAYLTPKSNTSPAQLQAMLNDTFYIAAALTPKVASQAGPGSFTFNGTTVNATTDMVYGNQPTQQVLSGGTAGPHQTYFAQFAFSFKSGPTARALECGVNVSCASGPSTSDGMYFMAFTVDTSTLNPASRVQFDIYNEAAKNNGGNLKINKFSAFSRNRSSELLPAPEPGSLVLLGSGAAALVVASYRRRRTR